MKLKSNSLEDLEIYNLAYDLAIEVHKISMKLPNYELFEQGSQIRRSSKSIKDNIVEGYGRKRYKSDFLKFLTYAHASCNETISQLKIISDIHFEQGENKEIIESYDKLGRKIHAFIDYVDNHWNS